MNIEAPTLQNVNFTVRPEQLLAIIGPVGAGKVRCICGLLRKKPRILVTHQLQYLKAADQIVVLKEGQMVARGTYSELQGSGIDFTSLLKEDQDNEGQNMTPLSGTSSSCHYTLSDNSSMSSLSSSRCSLIDGGDILTAVKYNLFLPLESRRDSHCPASLRGSFFRCFLMTETCFCV
ncbi:hypothetical protein XENOCAPTIV_004784 [Xenoophorus captivus]|uniref:ABC transporter domain-containing protein n=1 Tax=Xenoophorus captivus TaxID=1517983 RepID=A0ABV0SDC1_9TELE